MRIASKVFLGHGLTLGLLTVAGLVGLFLLAGDRDRFHVEFDRLESVERVTSEIDRNLHAGRWQVERFLRTPVSQSVEQIRDNFTRVQSEIKLLQSIPFSPDQSLQLEFFQKTVENYQGTFDDLEECFQLRGFNENYGLRAAFRQAAHDLERLTFVNDTSFLISRLEMLGHHVSDLVSVSNAPRVGQVYASEIGTLLPVFVSSVQKSPLDSVFKKEITTKLELLIEWKNQFNPDLVSSRDLEDALLLYEALEDLVRERDFGPLREKYSDIRRREKDYLLRGDEKYVAMVRTMIAQADTSLNILSQDHALAGHLRGQLRVYLENFDLLVETDAQINSLINKLAEISAVLSKQIPEIESFVERRSESQIAALVESGDRMGVRLLLLGVFALIAAVWFAFRFSKGISRPLNQAVRMLNSLEEGDFGSRLNLQRSDEIGDMSNALDGFAETLEAAMTAVVCAIVDRDQARLRLDHELAQKDAILAGFDGYIYVCSPDLRIEFMNQKLIERTGRDATGEYCYKALHDLDAVCEWCPNVNLDPGVPYHWDIQSPKDGRWYSIVNNLINFPGDQLRKLAMISDVTEHKEALQSLQFSEERYRQLFEKTPLPMWVVDMQSYRYLDVNQAAIETYGYSRDEFLTMTVMDIRPPEDILLLEGGLERAHNGEETLGLWRHQCKDGRLLDVVITLKDVFYDGRTVRLVMANDVTEAEILRRELDQSSRLAAIGELAAGVAHEINNPNGMMLMNLGLLTDVHDDLEAILDNHYAHNPDLELGKLPYPLFRKKVPYLLREMTAGGQRIKRIVGDLKGFARKEAIDDMSPLDLNAVAAAAERLVSYQLGKATSLFSVNYTENLPEISGNHNRLEQVVVNLLINATQALENRDQSISLSTGFSKDKKYLVVEVQDFGKGIAPENLDKIFDPFFTTRRNDGGTGLGLSLSRRIAEEHGGSLNISSSSDTGTIVSLSLPCDHERKR